MEFQLITRNELPTVTSDCIIVGIFEGQQLSPSATELDQDYNGLISRVIAQGDIQGKLGQTLLLHPTTVEPCKRILLVGCGTSETLDGHRYRKAITSMASALATTGITQAICTLAEINLIDNRSDDWKIQHLSHLILENRYRFEQFKSSQSHQLAALNKVYMIVNALEPAIAKALRIGTALAKGTELTRNLGNLPGNICTPSYLAEQAISLGKQYPQLKTSVLEQGEIENLGMQAFLAVAQGSEQPPKLITIEYQGTAATTKPVVLVGKGITFDTGGISLKQPPLMDEMKFDMCGAATVFGVIKAAAELQLPINIVGVIPATENMPSGKAIKPGDIVTSMSGQTIEILNTDAEGRLILCDALTYSQKFTPEVVIDIATLTGAMIVALGYHTTGMMSNNDALADELLTASHQSDDWLWRLPIHEDYNESLSSNFADMANISAPPAAGSITAACFLNRFTKDYRWAHLDIAGTASKSGKEKGATGRPVPLLLQFILNRCVD